VPLYVAAWSIYLLSLINAQVLYKNIQPFSWHTFHKQYIHSINVKTSEPWSFSNWKTFAMWEPHYASSWNQTMYQYPPCSL